MYPDNNWYGHRSVLADYCETKDTNAFASIQHGVLLFYLTKRLGRRSINLTPFLCWNKNIELWCLRHNYTNVISIGSPFIYLHLMHSKKKIIIKKKKRNVILFPSHSNVEENRDFNFNLLIEHIEKRYDPPYTVCFFYKDLNKNNKSLFLRKNWKIKCNGNSQNKNFLKNLYQNLIDHNIVVCNEVSSTLFYSLFLEKKTSLVYKIKKKKIFYISSLPKVAFKKEQYIKFMNRYNFLKNSKFIDKRLGKILADRVLGLQSIKNKEELKIHLGWNSRIKIFISRLFAFIIDLKYPNLRKRI
jgi:hypothetical protein